MKEERKGKKGKHKKENREKIVWLNEKSYISKLYVDVEGNKKEIKAVKGKRKRKEGKSLFGNNEKSMKRECN